MVSDKNRLDLHDVLKTYKKTSMWHALYYKVLITLATDAGTL